MLYSTVEKLSFPENYIMETVYSGYFPKFLSPSIDCVWSNPFPVF